MIRFKRFIVALVLLFFFQGYTQNYTDLQGRFIANVNYRFNKKWRVDGEYRYNLQKDFQEFQSSAAEVDLEYTYNKRWSISSGYRFTTSYNADSHRLFLSLKYNKKWDALTLSNTLKYQYETESFNRRFINQFKEPSQLLREKIGLDYNIPKSKASVYVATELFLNIDNVALFELKNCRYIFGLDYKFKYGNSLGLSVFYDDKINTLKTDRWVIETKYSVSLDQLIKKVKKEKKKKAKL